MHAIGSPKHALLLVNTAQNMCRQLPCPTDTVQGYWHAIDHVTWDHRNRTSGSTLFENTDPRALVHELQLYREPLPMFDARHAEMPGRLPEKQYLQIVLRLFGWNDFLSRISLTDMHVRPGVVHQLTYEVLDNEFHYEYRPAESDLFRSYYSTHCRQQLVSSLAQKLTDLVSSYAPGMHHRTPGSVPASA
jgi:hypothetical protein